MMDKYLIDDKDALLKSASFMNVKNKVSEIIGEIDKLTLFLNTSTDCSDLSSHDESFTFSKLADKYPNIVHMLFIHTPPSDSKSSLDKYKCTRDIMTAFGELKNEQDYLKEYKSNPDFSNFAMNRESLSNDVKMRREALPTDIKMSREELLVELPKLRNLYFEMSEVSKWDTSRQYLAKVLKESFEEYCKTRQKYNHIIKIKELNEAHYQSFTKLLTYMGSNVEDKKLKTIIIDKHLEEQIFIKSFVEKLELDKIKNQMEDHLIRFKIHMKLLNDSVLSFVKPSCCKSCLVNVPNRFISKCGHIICEHCTNILFGKNDVTECPFCMTSFEKLDLKDLDMNATKPETSETLVPFDTSDTPNDGNAITGISQWLFGRKA